MAALVLVTVLVIGQLTSWMHVAFTAHVECSEHGELIHVEVLAALAPVQSTIKRGVDVPDHPHRHEHCQIVSAHRVPLAHASKPLSAATEPCIAHSRLALSVDEPLTPAIEILRQAPKSSPPPSLSI